MIGKMKKGAAAMAAAAVMACSAEATPTPNYPACSGAVKLDESSRPAEFAVEQTIPDESELRQILTQATSGAPLNKFKSLDEMTQEEILKELHDYVTSSTNTGRLAYDINKTINVETEFSPELKKGFAYSKFTKKIYHMGDNKLFAAKAYLIWPPIEAGAAHERIHVIQDRASDRHDIRAFIGKHMKPRESISDYPQIDITGEVVRDYVRTFHSGRQLDYQTALRMMIDDFEEQADDLEESLVREIQAQLMFAPHMNAESLYSFMSSDSEYARLAMAVGFDEFKSTFASSIELLGMVNFVKAAEIAGKHGKTVEEYESAVKNLRECLGISSEDSYSRGIKIQQKILEDTYAMITEATERIRSERAMQSLN